MVRVPAGSTPTATPQDNESEQVQDFIGAPASATASRTWIVHGGVDQLLRYVAAHLRPGSKLEGTGSGGPGVDESLIRSWPPVKGVLNGRWLKLEAYAYGSHTYLTARAQSEWVVTRGTSERIPASVNKVTIKVTSASGQTKHQMTLTSSRIVHSVVALYNSLGVVQPATIMGCPPAPAGVIALRFYDSPTHVIATASSSTDGTPAWPASAAAWACFPISITLAQHHAPDLSGNVITPLSRLLHTKLTS